MTEQKQIYRCLVCGNITEVLHAGTGQLVCCGEPMGLQTANTVDASKEKHVPIIEKTENGFKIKVGAIPHPMEESHFIEWIEIVVDGISVKKFLKPGEAPEAEFCVNAETINARAYCNLHGLWQSAN